MAAAFILARVRELPHSAPPANTGLGALLSHVTTTDPKNYQPNNIQFALFDPNFFDGTAGLKRDELRQAIARQAPEYFKSWMNSCARLFS
jgi:methylenetetrahydrofolate--tRNA-(uracil-5-)-methyltransferase